MAKLNQNFNLWKSDYKELRFTVEDVLSLADCKAWWAMNKEEDPSISPSILKSTEGVSPGIVISGTVLIVTLLETDTDEDSLIEKGAYFHELRIEDAYGNQSTGAVGIVTLKPVLIKSTT